MTSPPSSRRYVKRLWRVPKDRGALTYFATVVTKALVKHGWPAKWQAEPFTDGFVILSHYDGDALPEDFLGAVEIAAQIAARTYRVDVSISGNWIGFNREYDVTKGGHFKEVKYDLSR